MPMDILWEILIATGVIAGAVGICFRRLEKKMDRDRAEREAHEQERKEFEAFHIRMQTATAALCEANAIALQNGKCNGETHAALDYLRKVKHDQREFLYKQGISHIME